MSTADAIVMACSAGTMLGTVIGALIPKDRIKDRLLFRSRNGGKP
jgi:hypothetical protein